MKHSTYSITSNLGFVFLLTSCGGRGKRDECGDFPITPSPDATIVKINGQTYSNPTITDIPIQRNAATSINVLFDYAINRTSSKCGGSYTGILTPTIFDLPQGVTANFTPPTIPASQGSTQTLQISLNISSQVPDGKIILAIHAPEVLPSFNPTYNVLLTTKP